MGYPSSSKRRIHSLTKQQLTVVRGILDQAGYSYVWTQPELVKSGQLISELEQRLTGQYIQSWSSELQVTTGKLRTYKMIKQDFKPEKYLHLAPHLRVPTARLRTSTHILRIETGRYNLPEAVPVEDRTCWFCNNGLIEDECHFLFDCQIYAEMQERNDIELLQHMFSERILHAFNPSR